MSLDLLDVDDEPIDRAHVDEYGTITTLAQSRLREHSEQRGEMDSSRESNDPRLPRGRERQDPYRGTRELTPGGQRGPLFRESHSEERGRKDKSRERESRERPRTPTPERHESRSSSRDVTDEFGRLRIRSEDRRYESSPSPSRSKGKGRAN